MPRPPRGTKTRSLIGRLSRGLVVAGLLLVVLSWVIVVPFRWIDPPTTAFMLRDDSGRSPVLHQWVKWEDMSSAPQIAVVAAEDQNFATHFGFDLNSIRESLDAFDEGESLRGASTVTQQVAKNLYLWPGKSFARKGIEAYLTVLIETSWPKKRILEVYLNVAEFGPGMYGIRAASETYFGKSPIDLNDDEAALLAAILPSPKRMRIDPPSPYVLERQSWIVEQMQRLRREGWLTSVDG